MGINMVCSACGKEFDDNRMTCPFCNAAADSDDILDFEILDAWDEDEEEEAFLALEEVQSTPFTAQGQNREEAPLENLEFQEISRNGEALELEEAQEEGESEVLELEEAQEEGESEVLELEETGEEGESELPVLEGTGGKRESEVLELEEWEEEDEPVKMQETDAHELPAQSQGEQKGFPEAPTETVKAESPKALEALETTGPAKEKEPDEPVEIQLEPVADEFEAYEIKIKVKEYGNNELMLNTGDILDTLKEDKRRVRAMICLFAALMGSFFNFWGIGTELLGSIKMGSLFAGYGFKGLLGKLCVLAALAGIGLIAVNLTRYAFFCGFAACLLLILQGGAVIFFSHQSGFEYANMGSIFFDVGFYVTAAFLILALILLRKINGRRNKGTEKPGKRGA